jgi:hypothetical protein
VLRARVVDVERSLKLDAAPDGRTVKVDAGTSLGTVERTPQGGIKVPANLTTHGIFEYNYGGKVVREFRSPEEVAKLLANKTLESAPVTDDHPYADRGIVTPDNFARLSKGHGIEIKADGDFIAGTIIIQDKALINKVDSRVAREVSLGIRSRDIAEPGVWNGQPYDVRQTDLVANHIAIVPVARVKGSALKLDSSGLPAQEEPQKENTPMLQIKIDGTVYPLGTDAERSAAIGAMERYQAKLDAQAAEHKTKVDGLEGKLAAALEEGKGLKAKLDAATDPATFEAALVAKAALRAQALKVLGAEAKLDGMTDNQIRVTVVAKAYPSIKLDGDVADKRPEYLAGLFESAVISHKADAQETANTNVLNGLGKTEVKQDAGVKTPEQAMIEAHRKAAEQPLAFSKK